MRRGLACVVAAGLLALSAAACTTGGDANEHDSESPGKNSASPASVVGRPQAASLAMSAGRSSAQYKITAPDPARYAFDVTVTAPASVDVSVSIRTWYGAIFPSILGSSHDAGFCRVRSSQDVCFELFPFLPAQRAGSWTVVAAKQSGPAATVHIVITFS
jgi:hypothetical protein